MRWNILKIYFSDFSEAIFPYKGVFVTKVVKANIIAFTKTEILRLVLFVTNPPLQKCQPLLHSALLKLLYPTFSSKPWIETKTGSSKTSLTDKLQYASMQPNSWTSSICSASKPWLFIMVRQLERFFRFFILRWEVIWSFVAKRVVAPHQSKQEPYVGCS